MKHYTELTSIEKINDFIASNEMNFLYISRPECSVCHAIWPKLRALLEQYPSIHLGHIDANIVEEVAAKFDVFAVPSLLLIIDSKEYIRADRFVRFERLEAQLDQIYRLYTGEHHSD
ncbi:thioredoxin family protein [Paenibacillus gorillae]|uniref:thioredoxin family protein n=1 Tax=Paenibacillus gorillae TaxID=1243662 RepID=UPI0004AD1365|nr:thioredoxin family protein [Paenibacillus gorillae]